MLLGTKGHIIIDGLALDLNLVQNSATIIFEIDSYEGTIKFIDVGVGVLIDVASGSETSKIRISSYFLKVITAHLLRPASAILNSNRAPRLYP